MFKFKVRNNNWTAYDINKKNFQGEKQEHEAVKNHVRWMYLQNKQIL